MAYQITVEIEDRDGNVVEQTFDKNSIIIGVDEGCDIVVTRMGPRRGVALLNTMHANTSRTHGIISCKDGKLVLIDAGTANGWHCLNGTGILPYQHKEGYPLKIGDQYYVGNSRITIVSFSKE